MKSLLTNRQVERLLSLLVILWGLRLAIPAGEILLGYLFSLAPIRYDDSQWWTSLWMIGVGAALVAFFPPVVRFATYYASEGKPREKRRWFARDLVAIILVLYACCEILYVVNQGFAFLAYVMTDFYFVFRFDFWHLLKRPAQLTAYLAAAFVILFYARPLSGWILRQTRVPGPSTTA